MSMRVAGIGWPDFSASQLACIPFHKDKPGITYARRSSGKSDYVGARTCLSLDFRDNRIQCIHPAPKQTGGKP